jgi:tRNA(Ile)-lysidine synthase
MATVVERVRQTVVRDALFGEGDVLIAGVSGGADSTCLAHVLAGLASSLGARFVGLAHLDHGLRPASAADAAFCADLAHGLGLAFETRRADIRSEARARGTSIEDAARTVRYGFLNEAAAALGATRIAVGHTRDDQAETVLLRLVRGAGPAGLAGILPRAGRVIRPLLDVRRAEVEAWLREREIAWREDESNQDRSIPRNEVRHGILPGLVAAFGGGVVDVLARQAALSRDDADWFEIAATEMAARLVLEEEGAVTVEQAALGALHPALARRVVLAALRRGAGGRFVGFEHVEAVLALAPGAGGIDLPGQRVHLRSGRLRFEAQAPDPGRAGRRRGRPATVEAAAEEPEGFPAVSNTSGSAPGGPKCAESASLEGHAPKGGRG